MRRVGGKTVGCVWCAKKSHKKSFRAVGRFRSPVRRRVVGGRFIHCGHPRANNTPQLLPQRHTTTHNEAVRGHLKQDFPPRQTQPTKQTMSHKEEQPSTEQKLTTIVESFDEFNLDMRTMTRVRKEKEEFKIRELKNAITRLDGELVAEVKRRTEMNRATQMWFEQSLATVNKQFHTTLDERTEGSERRLDNLSDMITALDQKRIRDRKNILDEVERTKIELLQMLAAFKAEFVKDQKLRVLREEELQRQLIVHEKEVDGKFVEQTDKREALYLAVRKILEDQIKLRDKAEERFQAFFERELVQLHNMLRVEKELREREDDEIVDALNKYTIKLQTSLNIINATNL